ncbi:unnamed protein product [Cyclocybe aegerita]|uniref:Uncharacterized protein n=1 Tax=Cyclocybe aegerita TaxID=1973307 RepID=A0A8S0VVA4_CYCAE|nr:unnamed protein product [Cyclocybe aegerita]
MGDIVNDEEFTIRLMGDPFKRLIDVDGYKRLFSKMESNGRRPGDFVTVYLELWYEGEEHILGLDVPHEAFETARGKPSPFEPLPRSEFFEVERVRAEGHDMPPEFYILRYLYLYRLEGQT